MEVIIDIFLLSLLVVTALAIIWFRHLVIVAVLSGLFSLLMASLFVIMDAVDVALTESAVGAGIATLLYLAVIRLVGDTEKKLSKPQIIPLVVVVVTGAILMHATTDMPRFGDPSAPAQTHVGPHYLTKSPAELAPIPNVVTSVLASYRGFDTMGEVVVVFTAGAGVMLLLGSKRRQKKSDALDDRQSSSNTQETV